MGSGEYRALMSGEGGGGVVRGKGVGVGFSDVKVRMRILWTTKTIPACHSIRCSTRH